MNEQSLQFENGLHGIHIDAAVAGESDRGPAFVLINAGYQHSVGPYRLYTDLARSLAASGYDSFRFDLPGIGNSRDNLSTASSNECLPGGCTGGNDAQKTVLDVLAMLTEKYGSQEFVLCGLCSGADDALGLATKDQRVVGVVAIDSAGFRAGKFNLYHYLRHYPRRLVSVSKWRNLLAQRKAATVLAGAGSAQEGVESTFSANDGYRSQLDPEYFRRTVTSLVAGKCHALFVYSGGIAHYYNHEAQFTAMTGNLELDGYVRVGYYPKADHLFFLTSHRQALITEITEWSKTSLVSSSYANNARAA